MAFNQCKLNLRRKYRNNTRHLLTLYRLMTVVDSLYEYYVGQCPFSELYLTHTTLPGLPRCSVSWRTILILERSQIRFHLSEVTVMKIIISLFMSTTVLSKVRSNIFNRSHILIVSSNPRGGIGVYSHFLYLSYPMYEKASRQADLPFQGVLPTLCKVHVFRR
jgi:hypothetical protein